MLYSCIDTISFLNVDGIDEIARGKALLHDALFQLDRNHSGCQCLMYRQQPASQSQEGGQQQHRVCCMVGNTTNLDHKLHVDKFKYTRTVDMLD